MSAPDPKILAAIARVQEACEAMAPGQSARHFIIAFADGDSARLDKVLADGRQALTDLAELFGSTAEEANHG